PWSGEPTVWYSRMYGGPIDGISTTLFSVGSPSFTVREINTHLVGNSLRLKKRTRNQHSNPAAANELGREDLVATHGASRGHRRKIRFVHDLRVIVPQIQ